MASSLEPLIISGGSNYRVWTPGVWSGINKQSIMDDPSKGCYARLSSAQAGGGNATATSENGWYRFLDTSDTIGGAKLIGGGLTLATAATDNNSPTLQHGGTTGAQFHVSKTTPYDLAWELHFRVTTIIETGTLLGLGEEGMAANNGCLADNTGATADKDNIGFRGLMHASTLTLDAVYRKAGQTEVTALAGALVPSVNVDYGVAFRFRKLTKMGEWWVNGAKVKELDFSNTTTVPVATCPFDELLSPVVCLKAGEAGAKTLVIRELDCFMQY